MSKTKRVVLYVRVSTSEQTTENQIRELTQWAERAGHDVVKVYGDAGISGAKGRDKRPGFDAMLKAATKREFDILAVWSSDRLGRSLPNLIEVLQTIRTTGRELYIHKVSGRMARQMSEQIVTQCAGDPREGRTGGVAGDDKDRPGRPYIGGFSLRG